MIANKRTLKLKADSTHRHLLEAFVEKVCDDYNIFNSYFGIVMYAVTETFNNVLLTGRKDEPFDITLNFSGKPNGLYFQFHVGERIYDLGVLLEGKNDSSQMEEGDANTMKVVHLLSDHLYLDADKGIVEIGFNIGSINSHLVLERTAALEHYYSTLNTATKV